MKFNQYDGHWCKGEEWAEGSDYWREFDYQGIYLCKVCEKCEKEHLSKYNPWVLRGYDQSDVDEDIKERQS